MFGMEFGDTYMWNMLYGTHRSLKRCGRPFTGQACMYVHKETGVYSLRSYDTLVCQCIPKKGLFHRCWKGWSRTTANHIRLFLSTLECEAYPPSKEEWEELPVRRGVDVAVLRRNYEQDVMYFWKEAEEQEL